MSVATLPERTRISADRFQKMIATAVLTKYDHIELIDGEMINMPPIGTRHSAVTARLNKLFVLSAGDSATVLPAGSVKLGDYSVAQPDLMLLKPREDFYAAQIVTATDVLLLVEISDSSLVFDQGAKRALYARYGIGEYWVVDVPGQWVHVYPAPAADGYAEPRKFGATESVSPRELPAARVLVGTLFA
jgi:Uma2 family endonuclease